MKLATLDDGSRDGRLVVVDDGGGRFVDGPNAWPSLWSALQDWRHAEPALRAKSQFLLGGHDPTAKPLAGIRFLAPLPRTTSWVDGSAFIQHIVLVRKARNAQPPDDLRTVPLMYQGVGDPLLPPNSPITGDEAWGIDLEAEVCVLLDDVPRGVQPAAALQHVKLIGILNDVSLRNLIPRELAAGFGFFQGKPPSAMGPFVVTPDELGPAWRDGRIHLDIHVEVNGARIGHPDCGEMFFGFHQLIAHAAKTRPLPAGTVLGSGTVSNQDEARGCGCLAEVRTLETICTGAAKTPFLRKGDKVRIDLMDTAGRSVCGVIEQEVVT